ncbi:hypothetical protein F383_30677 [Gossypium arboreum]|uniref:Uncharacterized protein n=1 Tax=Gossypium arboreum TaxID=29729 RepID=A0A0B0MXQ3_GOSAR|nr:hypothetical protein F383_30677 [Gossypium arboreum]
MSLNMIQYNLIKLSQCNIRIGSVSYVPVLPRTNIFLKYIIHYPLSYWE